MNFKHEDFKHELKNLEVFNKNDFIIKNCNNKNILHLGAIDSYEDKVCGLHSDLIYVANKIIGIDIDSNGIQKAEERGIKNIFYGDVERLENSWQNISFDVILATEIIEHLHNPGNFLESIKNFFSDNTIMIITTPNVLAMHRIFYSLLTRKEYVHPEHINYYSYNTLKTLLESHNFRIYDTYYYTLGRNFEKIYKIFPRFSTGLIFLVSCNKIKNNL